MPYNAWIIIETHEFRSLVENVFVFFCCSTWWRTCSRSLPLSLISLITRLRGSKSTPNNFQAPINHILLCYLASLVWASVSTKSLRWNSPPPQRKTVECCGWKWTRWRWGGDGDWGGWGVIPDGCTSNHLLSHMFTPLFPALAWPWMVFKWHLLQWSLWSSAQLLPLPPLVVESVHEHTSMGTEKLSQGLCSKQIQR